MRVNQLKYRPNSRCPLDADRLSPHSNQRQSAGRPLRQGPKGRRGGKSGLHGHTVPDNVRRGRTLRGVKLQGQCHRERTACGHPSQEERTQVRVKRCGKSAPRRRQRRRHGKPHREQDRIGTAREQSRDRCPDLAVRVGCFRRRATGVAEEWPSRAARKCRALQNPAYRPIDMLRGLGGKTAGPPPTLRVPELNGDHRPGGVQTVRLLSTKQILISPVLRLKRKMPPSSFRRLATRP